MKNAMRQLTATAHRTMFFCGIVQGLLAVGWWLGDLLARYAGWYTPVNWSVAPAQAHAYLMTFGFFTFFIFGFLMTAVPNWLGGGRVSRPAYMAGAGLMLGGLITMYVGLAVARTLVALGMVLHLAGWAIAWRAVLRLVTAAPGGDKRFASMLLALMALGWIGAALFLASLATGISLFDAARRIGVWWCLSPVFFSVATRLVPFFSSRVIPDYVMVRHAWAVPAVLGLTFAHGLLELVGAMAWLWLADLPLLAIVAYHAFVWGLMRSFGAKLLAVLHLAFAGFAVALLLFTVQSAALALGGVWLLGAGPLHALTIGYFTATVVAMASRVSLGHSGRELVADRLTWGCFLGVLLAAGLRVAAESPWAIGMPGWRLSVMAAALWLACFAAWAYRYLPMYWQPRADGRPG